MWRAKWEIAAGEDISIAGNGHCGSGIKSGGDVTAEKEICVASGIQAAESVICGSHLDSGWGLIAGGDIVAEGSIRAGEGVEAGGKIEPGAGHGVYAGLSVRVDAWAVCARVIAQVRPEQLVSDHWALERL